MDENVIMGNVLGMPSPRPDWNETNPLKGSFIRNKPDFESLRNDANGLVVEVTDIWRAVNLNTEAVHMVTAPPITAIPNVLEANKSYNFGTVEELLLVFPTEANDGDVIYITFRSDGLQATNLIVNEINMHDEFDLIPEHGEGYEIYAKYIDGSWLVKYSSYIPSAFDRLPDIEEE